MSRVPVQIDVKLKLGQTNEKVKNASSIAIRMMLEDIHTKAEPATPKRGGQLRGSVLKQMLTPYTGRIVWTMPYAAYQERGMRANGSRPVANYTTPGTHAHFAEEAMEAVVPNYMHYMRLGGLV